MVQAVEHNQELNSWAFRSVQRYRVWPFSKRADLKQLYGLRREKRRGCTDGYFGFRSSHMGKLRQHFSNNMVIHSKHSDCLLRQVRNVFSSSRPPCSHSRSLHNIPHRFPVPISSHGTPRQSRITQLLPRMPPIYELRRRHQPSALQASFSAAARSLSGKAPIPTPGETKVPSYQMVFTCKFCRTRSSHIISKQGYHNGTVLITCPDCKNRHVISDHYGYFVDKAFTVEDLLKEKGELLRKGAYGEDGKLEIWDDPAASEEQSERQEPSPKE